jgi:glycosyltransferase involved in cell wall biosynthesis
MPVNRSQPARRLRLLVVAPQVPRDDHTGGDLRVFTLLGLLARRHHVDFFAIYDPEGLEATEEQRARLRSAGVRLLPGVWLTGLEDALGSRIYDAVLFAYWGPAQLGMDVVARNQPWAQIIVDSVEVMFRRDERGSTLGIPGLDADSVTDVKQRELAVYRKADAVMCVSDEDAGLLEAEGGIERRYTIPLVVTERPRSVRTRNPEVLILGAFHYLPNADGLLWFVRTIWPAIRGAVADARLRIVGSRLTPEVTDLAEVEGVDVAGYVAELDLCFDRAALLVAPLRFGSGVKTKVVEAMAAGLPVVTTQVGAQGMEVTSGEQLIVVDEPEDFAREVIALLRDSARAEEIGQAGRAYVTTLCSANSVESRIEAMLAATVNGTRPSIPPLDWLINWPRIALMRVRASLGMIRRSAFSRQRRGTHRDSTMSKTAADPTFSRSVTSSNATG